MSEEICDTGILDFCVKHYGTTCNFQNTDDKCIFSQSMGCMFYRASQVVC